MLIKIQVSTSPFCHSGRAVSRKFERSFLATTPLPHRNSNDLRTIDGGLKKWLERNKETKSMWMCFVNQKHDKIQYETLTPKWIFTFLANGAHLRCRWGGNPLGFARPFASHTQKRQRVSQLSWSSHCEQIRIGFVRGFCLKQSDPNIGNPAVELSQNNFNPSTSNIFSNFTAFFIHIWKTLSTTPRDSLCFNRLLELNHPISQGKPPNERRSSRFRRLGRKKHETTWYLKNVWEFWPQKEYIHAYIHIYFSR